jgi:hypothetical protein
MWSWSILMRLNLISKGDCYSVMNRLMNGLLISFGDEPPPVVAASRCLVGSPPHNSPSFFLLILFLLSFYFRLGSLLLSFIALLRRNS